MDPLTLGVLGAVGGAAVLGALAELFTGPADHSRPPQAEKTDKHPPATKPEGRVIATRPGCDCALCRPRPALAPTGVTRGPRCWVCGGVQTKGHRHD